MDDSWVRIFIEEMKALRGDVANVEKMQKQTLTLALDAHQRAARNEGVLARNAEDVEKHIKRTDLLQEHVDRVSRVMDWFAATGRIVKWVGAVAAVVLSCVAVWRLFI